MIPFPKPIDRDQARSNAIHFAERALEPTAHGNAEGDLRSAEVWTAIAATFPEDCIECSSESEGMTSVSKDWMEEAVEAIAFKNRNQVEPGYSLMAVTAQEMRTVMALRTGVPRDLQKPAVGSAVVPAPSGQVPVDSRFYAAVMAVVVATIQDQAENGMLNVHPEDIEATRGKVVHMTESDLPGEGPVISLRLTDSES
jgi:hypothetical protein